ncbi:MAG: ATP-binding protein [Nanoarchaeota archaeon]|nr:ATP-binding protein [Nanoarchaeota archaeon]
MDELIRANPWWKEKTEIENDFHIKKVEKSTLSWQPVFISVFEQGLYSIRGPRQVGKTTWMKLTIKDLLRKVNKENIMYFNCDILNNYIDILNIIRNYFELFENKDKRYIFLDEVSYIEDWQKAIKHLYDSGELENCVVVVTGSFSIDIKKSIEKLPGRIGLGKRHFKILPLSFAEFLEARGSDLVNKKNKKLYIKELNKELHNYLITGGFPMVIDYFNNHGYIDETFYEIYKNWIIGDLEKWSKSEKYSKQIFKRIIETFSSEVNWEGLSSGTDIDAHSTIQSYVSLFEDIFAVNYINKMDYNKNIPDYPKSKKIYFADPFIFYSVWKWCYGEEKNFEYFKDKMRLSDFKSKIIEMVVLNNIVKRMEHETKLNNFDYKDNVFYWFNKTKSVEVDFVIKKDLKALEVKWTNRIRDEHFKAQKYFDDFKVLTKDKVGKNRVPVCIFLIEEERLL